MLEEIKRIVGLSGAKLAELAGTNAHGANVKYVSSLGVFGSQHHTKYLSGDKVHWSPNGLTLLGEYLLSCVGAGEGEETDNVRTC